jgi:hypothetical protein
MPEPAAELRAAAQRLRTLAEAARPAPWAWREQPGAFGPIGCVEMPIPGQDAWTGMTTFTPLASPDAYTAQYIAAMHPGVALALADLLDSYAFAALEEAAEGTNVEIIYREELALARLMLEAE